MTIQIEITRSLITVIDNVDADCAIISWYATKGGYAARTQKINGVKKVVYLHRKILERKIGRSLSGGEVCDHINRDSLDNRRENLRVATLSQSVHNTSKKKGGVFKGVYYSKYHHFWCAKIMVSGVTKHVGYFNSPEDAARGYDYWAMLLHKEFSSLNFPGDKNNTVLFWKKRLGVSSRNASGLKCVYQNGSKWAARTTKNGRKIFLGNFNSPEEASEAYIASIKN